MMTHNLKTWPEFFGPLWDGTKAFECRHTRDREFNVDDTLVCQEWDPTSETYSGRELRYVVTYVMTHADFPGVAPGFAILGMRRI